jgi:two-component system invasion response regulator UvrY
MVSRPTVLLADDHQGNRQLLRDLLASAFDVVADVKDGSELVQQAERLSPDVIVTDISMPGMGGIEAARRILTRNPAARIVFVTGYRDPALVDRGLAIGALGYVAKTAAAEWLVAAVRAALQGEHAVFGVVRDRERP